MLLHYSGRSESLCNALYTPAATNFTGPFNGTATLNPDQTITYQSDPDFNASDVLYYRVSDQFGKLDIGQLIIDVPRGTS